MKKQIRKRIWQWGMLTLGLGMGAIATTSCGLIRRFSDIHIQRKAYAIKLLPLNEYEKLPSEMTDEMILKSFVFVSKNKQKEFILETANLSVIEKKSDDKHGSLDVMLHERTSGEFFWVRISDTFINEKIYTEIADVRDITPQTYTLDKLLNLEGTPFEIINSNPYYAEYLQKANRYYNQSERDDEVVQFYANKTGFLGFNTDEETRIDILKTTTFRQSLKYQVSFLNYIERNKLLEADVMETDWDVDINVVNQLIKKNPYGYLPSGFLQFFNWLSPMEYNHLLKSKKIFANAVYVEGISFRSSDRHGELEFYILLSNGKYIYKKINHHNSLLKTNEDYYRYIFDRTISLNMLQTNAENNLNIISGTGFILDRIPTNEPDTYTFLVATNNHVLNMRSYDDEKDSTKWFNKDSYDKFLEDNKAEISNEAYEDKDRYKYLLWGKAPKKSAISNSFSSINGVGFSELSKVLDYTEDNYKNTFFFAPQLTGHDFVLGSNKKETKNIDKIDNGTIDFVVIKMTVNKKDVDKQLPELSKIIGTPNEQAWYVNYQINYPYHPQVTTFSAGYVGASDDSTGLSLWKGSKGVGNLVISSQHVLQNTNILTNGKHPTGSDGYRYNIGSQIYSSDELGTLTAGSSGSMIIDANFNLVGIHYAGLEEGTGNNQKNSIIGNMLFSYSPDLDGDVDAIGALRTYLKANNIYTIKLNRK
ncbi:DUF31 family protein [Ureaplasma miroungigenitalium]|uniref:DUF31 family protein n=1 Tax=Ureaplasma miroungigenitalium TaxID=1042321 RepID=UPI0021E7CEA3|nr:DUF31 family protein [Ureaplasma miroungigenitalium]MCV3734501.1 DUF31 family protein [Ureaplasma miroungigenitalium]